MRCLPSICRPRRVDHWLVCQHQIEIEIWPATAEAYFLDERHCDPVNTQVRFDAAVYNAPDREVTWEVRALNGAPGQGVIDATGLYVAPNKNGLPSGHTEVIVATARADPMRQAFAYVTLVGRGPEPPPQPTVLLLPARAYLYYRQGAQNTWIDASNTRQVFRALVQHSHSGINWKIDGAAAPGADHGFLYSFQAPATGPGEVKRLTAELSADPTVGAEAKVMLINYEWPGIV